MYPLEYPFRTTACRPLPWNRRYWKSSKNRHGEISLKCNGTICMQDIDAVVKTLSPLSRGIGSVGGVYRHGLPKDKLGMKTDREMDIKGLTAECMIHADVVMSLINSKLTDFSEVAIQLTAAYESLYFAQVECEPFLGEAAENPRRAGHARQERSPAAGRKALIKIHWIKWKDKPTLYASDEEFARQMIIETQYPDGSTQVITRWVREWRKEGD